MLDADKRHVHCIGIGGIGVSGLAELLLAHGIQVSGSDVKDNVNTTRLRALGAKIVIGHAAQNIHGADSVIYSSAIAKTNPEFRAAIEQGLPVISRGAALADFVNAYTSVAVAGTHGKTTTTGLVASALMQGGVDPSYVVGGVINNAASPTHVGQGDVFVAEVDESDASFLFMRPNYAIVTNIDADHLETYGGDFTALQRSFVNFLEKIPSHGLAFMCIDDPVVAKLVPKLKTKVITYGFSANAQVRVTHYRQQGLISEFTVKTYEGESFSVSLSIPGRHNVQNALGAIAVAKALGVATQDLQQALLTFPGMSGRFHGHGQMQLRLGEATVIEDYGHHPREINATLEAARMSWPDRRIVCVFQPHRYSRTRDLYKEFVEVLCEADKLYLLDVFSAGESLLADATSADLLEDIAKRSQVDPEYVKTINELPGVLYEQLHDGDVVILQGAGSVGSVAKQLLVKHAV